MFNKFLALSLTGLLMSATLHAEGSSYVTREGQAKPPVQKEEMGDINYHVYDLTYHTPAAAGVRSLLIPGWGQAFNGETRKGTLYLGVTTILAVSAFVTYNDAQKSYNDYNAGGRSDSSTYRDYSSKFNLSLILATLTAVIWGVSVADAAQSAHKVSQANAGTTLAMNEQGNPELVYQRRF